MKSKTGRKLLSFLLTLAMVVGLFPGMSRTTFATDNPFYTLDGTITGGGSTYAKESDITQNNVSWKVKGNTLENPWRIGGKSISGENRDVYSTGTINSGITEVMLELGNATITVNSVTLTVASDSSFSTVLAQQTKNGVAANSTLSFKPTSGTWSNAYYKFTFNVTNSFNSNKHVEFKAAKFYGAAATVPVTGVTLNPSTAQSINVGGSVAFTATVAPDGATDKTVKWSTTGGVTLYSDENCTAGNEIGADATSTLTVYAKGISAGEATVTVTSNADSSKSASCNVTVGSAASEPENIIISPASGDIAEALAAAEEGKTVGDITINLTEGVTYTISNTIVAPASLTINGNGAIMDAGNLNAPMIALANIENPTQWTELNIAVSGLYVNGLKKQMFYSACKNYLCKTFTVDNCVVEVAADVITFDFTKGSVAESFVISNSTFYAPTATTKSLYSSQGGQKATEYYNGDTDTTQSFKLTHNTFFNLAPTKNFFVHRQNSQKWLSYEAKGNVFANCGKSGQVIIGLNGSGASANPTWNIDGNLFNYDGADTSAAETTGDNNEPVKNSVAGVVTFVAPASGNFNGTLELSGGATLPEKLGDPRFTLSSHTHSFTYSASGATITATCDAAGCDLTDNKVTLTIVPNPVLYYDDGQPKEASLEGLEAFNAATGKNISTDNIAYYKGDTNVTAQIKAGSGTSIKGTTYTARLDVEGKRATVTFTLTAKPTPHTHSFTYTANGAVITATCTQNASNMEACNLTNKQATLTLNAPLHTTYGDGKDANATLTGEIPGVTNPTIHYSKGSVTLNSAPTDAGTYTAWCQLGNATARVEYTIAKATNPGWTTLPQAKANLVYTGEPLELITAGTASGGSALYTVGTDPNNEPDDTAGGRPYTSSVPEMTNAGTYYVWCKIDGGKNYTSINAQKVDVTIARANPTATAPSGSATYGQTLADVTLTNPEGNTPGTWAWVDSTTSVGSVGENTFSANFTPTDTTNYNSVSNVEVTVNVGKADAVPATVTANNRTCDNTDQPLVTVTGTATGGEMQYALGIDATTAPASGWSASVPTATDAGTYYVWYKVQGDDDHFDVEAACVTVTVTTIVVSFAENGGSEVDDQIVPIGGKAVRPEDPTRLGYDFVDWYADEGCTEVFDFETVIEQNTVVYALWESVPFPETLTLAQDYLLLLPDDTFQLEVIDAPRAWLASIAWSSDNEAVATVDDKGTVTAVAKGVAWIKATLDPDSSSLTALCRIDVTDEYPEVTAVRLVDTKATAELYSTDYTRIEVLPELLQNQVADRSASADERRGGPVVTAIENARFADAATAAAFDLRVVDDRTLEIVPKDEFVQGDAAKLKTLKSRYKSAVIVTIDGQEFTTPQVLQLSVKKTKPRITAKIKAFNSFIPGDTQAFVFSGGVPETVVVESAPAWLSVDTDALTAAYMGAVDLKLKDKVILNVKPTGWAFTTQVTVNVSVAKTAPKFSLSPSTVRLKPGVDALASANAVLGNADPALQEIAVLNVMEGKTNAEGALDVTIDGSSITVRPGKEAPTDGKAHTYKVTLAILRNGMPTDATRTLTVRLLEESREVSVTAKAAGAIDPAIPESPVTVTLTAKNANAASVNVTEVTVAAAAGTAAPQDVTDRFDIEIDGLTVTFRQAGGAALDTSLTYTATIRTNVGAAATVKLTVKTNANPKPTVTLKAAGAIDVIRPDSAVTVTHKVKDCFTYAPALEDLRIWKVTKVNGKRTYEPADDKFDVRMENGAYVLTLKPGTKVDHTKDKFAVSLSGALDGTPFESAKTDITVKLGSARIKQSTKSVTLLKDDRNSRASVTITVATAGVNGIDWDKTLASIVIPVDKDNQPLFEVERVGQDIVIRFANSELKEFKSAKVKVSVFLLGNNSTKPNKTLSISVKLG